MNSKIPIKTTTGIHLTEKFPIFYEASIPLSYTAPMYHSKKRTRPTAECKLMTACPLMKNFDLVNQLSYANLGDVWPLDKTNLTRHKRGLGLDFIASIENWCCGIATQKSVNEIYTTEHKLKMNMQVMKSLIDTDHADILQADNI